jgi:hypothetical protein
MLSTCRLPLVARCACISRTRCAPHGPLGFPRRRFPSKGIASVFRATAPHSNRVRLRPCIWTVAGLRKKDHDVPKTTGASLRSRRPNGSPWFMAQDSQSRPRESGEERHAESGIIVGNGGTMGVEWLEDREVLKEKRTPAGSPLRVSLNLTGICARSGIYGRTPGTAHRIIGPEKAPWNICYGYYSPSCCGNITL